MLDSTVRNTHFTHNFKQNTTRNVLCVRLHILIFIPLVSKHKNQYSNGSEKWRNSEKKEGGAVASFLSLPNLQYKNGATGWKDQTTYRQYV